jgi:fatty acid desaturase
LVGELASMALDATATQTKPVILQTPILARSLTQLTTSFGGFFATCAAMYTSFEVSAWIALPLSTIAAGFLVRIFIIQHDCGHGSFFKSRRANDLIGIVCSLMTLTPYAFWRRQHARHHGSWNNLDRRAASGMDIYSSCMTVAEYRALPRWRRGVVRSVHNPIVANLLLPPVLFIILYRTPFDAAKGWRRERRAVYLTNIALAALFGGLGLVLGYRRVTAVQLPIMMLASIVGVWLFSVQHRHQIEAISFNSVTSADTGVGFDIGLTSRTTRLFSSKHSVSRLSSGFERLMPAKLLRFLIYEQVMKRCISPDEASRRRDDE